VNINNLTQIFADVDVDEDELEEIDIRLTDERTFTDSDSEVIFCFGFYVLRKNPLLHRYFRLWVVLSCMLHKVEDLTAGPSRGGTRGTSYPGPVGTGARKE